MVARQFASGRAVAVAIATIFLMTLVPMPTAVAQSPPIVSDLSVVQGEAKFYQTNFLGGNEPTQFVDNGRSSITLKVPVYQDRQAAETTNVPVYWFLYGPGTPTSTRGNCVPVNVGAATGTGLEGRGKGEATITIDISDLPAGAYNVSVSVLNKHNGHVPNCGGTGAQAPKLPCGGTAGTTVTNCINDLTPGNNTLRAYFVKGHFLDLQIAEILWCAGKAGQFNNECVDSMDPDVGEAELWNRTYQQDLDSEDETKLTDSTRATFFEVRARNVGSWRDMINWGGPSNGTADRTETGTPIDGWIYELNVSLSGLGIDGKLNLSRNVSTLEGFEEDAASPIHHARSTNWTLRHMAGRYNVTVKLDGKDQLRKNGTTDTSIDIAQRNADVLYRDFTGNFTASDLRTDPANPYLYDGSFRITGHATLKNVGTANRLGPNEAGSEPSTTPPAVSYSIYIDNLSTRGGVLHPFVKNGSYTPQGHGAESVELIEFDFNPTSLAGDTRFIPAGRHTIYAKIDSGGSTFELNETNNAFAIDIYVADTAPPTFADTPKMVKGYGGSVSDAPRDSFFPHEPFLLYANVTDSDAGLTIVANFTLDSDPNVTKTYNFTKFGGITWVSRVGDFGFHNFTDAVARKSESWTWRIVASDSGGLNNTSAPQRLTLVPWPIHYANADYILDTPAAYPDSSIPWDSTVEPTWLLHLQANQTGFWGAPPGQTNLRPVNQQLYVDNLQLEVVTAKNRTFWANGSARPAEWTPRTQEGCRTNRTATGSGPGGVEPPIDDPTPELGDPECAPSAEVNTDRFQTSLAKDYDGAGPGKWNYSVRIKDVANYTHYINGTVTIVDAAPTIHLVNLSAQSVTPGANFTLLVNATDDDKEIDGVHVNFTRTSSTDGAYVNLTLVKRETHPVEGVPHYEYNQTFKTGRHEDFGLGGVFNVTVWVKDLTGNWAKANLGTFNVLDDDVPVLTDHGVSPRSAQVGENVTFFAKARDSTNVTVRLEVFRATGTSELLMDPVLLTEDASGNFTYQTNFSAEGSYAWRMTALDSVNRPSPAVEGSLGVRNNVGPRFEVRSPSVLIDGTRYGSGAPRVEIVLFDVEGIDASSVSMKIANQTADFTLTPAPGNLNGYLLTHEVRSNRKFSHRDVVTINVTATDNSSEALRETLEFSFTVDDVAPVARIGSIAPSYRDQPAHVLNVSLNSRFTLTADDNDGLPTGVESIRYRILGGGPSAAETIYTGPFKINDAPGVYTGPRLYQIQFWAEDALGNFNRNFNTTTVYVDDTPPALFQFFPQGRSINATFVDDRVGVNRSVVWHRVNAEPFVPLPLVEREGVWALTLPEGVKGDRVSYYLQAWDRLDNTETFGNASAPYASFDVSNHEPRIRLTAPVDGGRIFRTVDLTWEASDEDGDALVFTVYYKGPGRATFVELAKIENSATRRYTIDTTRFQDGQYTFRLAGSDGGFVKLAETTVTVLNRASAVGVVSVPNEIVPGDSMIIKAEITKAEATVEARLYLGNDLVGSYPMNDQGKDGDEAANDGFYSVRVPVEAAGDYSVEIFAEYREDGEMKQFSSPRTETTFSAKLTPSYLLGTYGAIIALIGLLAAVGIGVAVFVVMRRR